MTGLICLRLLYLCPFYEGNYSLPPEQPAAIFCSGCRREGGGRYPYLSISYPRAALFHLLQIAECLLPHRSAGTCRRYHRGCSTAPRVDRGAGWWPSSIIYQTWPNRIILRVKDKCTFILVYLGQVFLKYSIFLCGDVCDLQRWGWEDSWVRIILHALK